MLPVKMQKTKIITSVHSVLNMKYSVPLQDKNQCIQTFGS